MLTKFYHLDTWSSEHYFQLAHLRYDPISIHSVGNNPFIAGSHGIVLDKKKTSVTANNL